MKSCLKTIILLTCCTLLTSICAAQSYSVFLNQGNAAYRDGNYDLAERRYVAAKGCSDARQDPKVLTMLDEKINDARKNRISQLEKALKAEETSRARAEEDKLRISQLQKQTETARRNATSLGLALRIRNALASERNAYKAMRLTAFGMRCVDPGNPTFLLEFMDEFNAQPQAAAFHPIPKISFQKNTNTFRFSFAPKAKTFLQSSYSAPYFNIIQLDNNGNATPVDADSLSEHYNVALSSDGTRVAFYTTKNDGTIYIKKLRSGKFQAQTDTLLISKEKMTNIRYLPSGSNLLLSYPTRLVVWNTDSNQLVLSIKDLKTNNDPTLLAFKNHIAWSNAETVQLWNIAGSEPVLLPFFFAHADVIKDLAVSADQKKLLSGSKDGTVKLWDLETGRELRSYKTGDGLTKIALSADGQIIATGGTYGKVSIWDAETGLERIKLPTLNRRYTVRGLEFIGSTRQLLVAYDNGETHIWNLNDDDIIRNLCQKSSNLSSKNFEVEDVRKLNLYEVLTANLWGMDSLVNSGDTVLMVSIANYLVDLLDTEHDSQTAATYFEHAERLFLRANEKARLSDLYYQRAKYLVYHGDFQEASKFLKKVQKVADSKEPIELLKAHIELFTGQYLRAIPQYLNLLDYKASRKPPVENEKIIESFRKLSLSRAWTGDRKKQLLLEKTLRILGVPLTNDPSQAIGYSITPLQTTQLSLGDLLREFKGADSLSSAQTDRILSMYRYAAEEIYRPKRRNQFDANNYPEAIKMAELEIGAIKEYLSVKADSRLKKEMGKCQGSYAFYLLFTKQYQQAREAAEAGFENSGDHWIKTNLGHAYLLMGNKEKAFEIYRDIKDRKDDSKENPESTLADALLKDFEDLVEAGVRNPLYLEAAAIILGRDLTDEEKIRFSISSNKTNKK
ncbi:MAG: WD40 repeat domain-containing protein [Saprospiraceae bacterium]|nr:WD40 repeat domain-containing protein [Saprospiraceae bacterium]